MLNSSKTHIARKRAVIMLPSARKIEEEFEEPWKKKTKPELH